MHPWDTKIVASRTAMTRTLFLASYTPNSTVAYVTEAAACAIGDCDVTGIAVDETGTVQRLRLLLHSVAIVCLLLSLSRCVPRYLFEDCLITDGASHVSFSVGQGMQLFRCQVRKVPRALRAQLAGSNILSWWRCGCKRVLHSRPLMHFPCRLVFSRLIVGDIELDRVLAITYLD